MPLVGGAAVARPVVDGAAQGRGPGRLLRLRAALAAVAGHVATPCTTGWWPAIPCSRRTSPAPGKQRPYVATTEQVWALHDAIPEHLRAGGPARARSSGCGLAEACGLRVSDVDFMRGVVAPAVQYPAEPLKTRDVADAGADPAGAGARSSRRAVARSAGDDASSRTSSGGRRSRRGRSSARSASARAKVAGLPADFRFHDLRHYFASLLIASGADVKVVQARLRHASAKTTLDTYGHLWPDADESARGRRRCGAGGSCGLMRTSGSVVCVTKPQVRGWSDV